MTGVLRDARVERGEDGVLVARWESGGDGVDVLVGSTADATEHRPLTVGTTATTSLSTNSRLRSMRSSCPRVIGSKLPA